jgi:hypothetical protein
MLGILYLLLSIGLGWAICCVAFPKLSAVTATDYLKRKINVSPYMLLFPVWYVAGTLALTWAVYILAYLNKNAGEPLFYANMIAMPVAFLAMVLVYIIKRRKTEKFSIWSSHKRTVITECIFLAGVLLLANILMWTTFYVEGNDLTIGVSVFSDFSPHVGMIRSFSHGNNFPTTYPHYAGEDIRYHFMFQFLVGNLEYLGLRIDYAFNIPSIISFVCAFMLLYLLAVKISGRIGVGLLSGAFFAFRSSKSLFYWISQLPEGTDILQALLDNTEFISSTPNEDWGLWNLNVYCNQRHLALGLTVMFFLLILYLPHLYEMFEAIKLSHFRYPKDKKNGYTTRKLFARGMGTFRTIFLTKAGWEIRELRTSIAAGFLLGSLGFFHGAAVIGVLVILFVLAVISSRRLEFLITAVIATAVSALQTNFFIHGSAVSPQLLFGFIAENKTLFGVASYLERLLGILPWVLLAAFCIEKGAKRYVMIAFSAPLLFAFTVSLTVDVTVNHKYIMMSCILLGIIAADIIVKLFDRKRLSYGVLGVFLIFLLTATGLYDFATVIKKNTQLSPIVLKLDHPLTNWIDENSTSQDLFLTDTYTINQAVLGGAMLYEGWPYYPWSAGYDTDYRTAQVKQMYEADTSEELNNLVKANHIRFIIIDRENRSSEEYELNENTIQSTYECVYTEGEGEENTSIYDTAKPLEQ